MKKVFVFLSIFLLSFSGVLFACNEDKYADLRVVLSSVTNADSGGTLSPNEDGVYEIYYGDTVRINAEVSSSSDVSRVLDFVSHSSDNFPEISSSRTQTSAEFKAEMPSKGEIFRVTVKSRETNRGSLDLRFNVLLPTDEISLSDNLGLVSGIELDLNDNVDFVSDLRAPTPSAAAELLTFNIDDRRAEIAGIEQVLRRAISKFIEFKKNEVQRLSYSFLNSIDRKISICQNNNINKW